MPPNIEEIFDIFNSFRYKKKNIPPINIFKISTYAMTKTRYGAPNRYKIKLNGSPIENG